MTKTAETDKQQASPTNSSSGETSNYYAHAAQKKLRTIAVAAVAAIADNTSAQASTNTREVVTKNASCDIASDSDRSDITDFYDTPVDEQQKEDTDLPLYTKLTSSSQPQNAGYRGYDYHFSPRTTSPDDYVFPNRSYGQPAYEAHPRASFLNPMSHIECSRYDDRNFRDYYPRHQSSSYSYDTAMARPRRHDQVPTQSSLGSMDQYTVKAPNNSENFLQRRKKSTYGTIYEQYDGELEIGEETDKISPKSTKEQTRTFDIAAPMKQNLANYENVSMMPVGEDLYEEGVFAVASDDELFVAAVPREAASPKTGCSRKGIRGGKASLENTFFDENNRVTKRRVVRPNSGAIENAPVFETSMGKIQAALKGKSLNATGMISSPADRKARWEIHTEPQLINITGMSNARKKKLGIPVDAKGAAISKPRGVNNPENIMIVNLKDVEGKSFEEIAQIVNDERIKKGQDPNQHSNSINCRYNRTAPHMYQARGIPFVRIADRDKANGKHRFTKAQEDLIWDQEMDEILVDLEDAYRKNKWAIIAKQFGKKSGHDWATAEEIANRFQHI